MYDVKNMSVWKERSNDNETDNIMLSADITELNLGVRSFNCLKRAGCHTVADIIMLVHDEEKGLKKIRNLGAKSEAEILAKLDKYTQEYSSSAPINKKITIIKPAKKLWDTDITSYGLSDRSLRELNAKGIRKVKDLYSTNPGQEPGWYSVRELFEKMPSYR